MRLPEGAALLALLLASAATAAEVAPSTLLSREAAHQWRAVGRVNVAGARDRSQCTGALIAPDVVLTAAHCLVHPGTGQVWPLGNIHFVAGWYGGEMTGHARAAAAAVDPGYSPGDLSRSSVGADLGLIRLHKPLSAEAAPPFAIGAPPLPDAPLTLVSYRRDRAHAPTLQECQPSALDGPVLVLACPVTFGASGSPVFRSVGGEMRVVGVLSAMSSGQAVAASAEGVMRLLEVLPD